MALWSYWFEPIPSRLFYYRRRFADGLLRHPDTFPAPFPITVSERNFLKSILPRVSRASPPVATLRTTLGRIISTHADGQPARE